MTNSPDISYSVEKQIKTFETFFTVIMTRNFSIAIDEEEPVKKSSFCSKNIIRVDSGLSLSLLKSQFCSI